MISYKRKYLYALVTFIVGGVVSGAGSPVNLYLGFPVLANVLYCIALILFFVAIYHLAIGLNMSYEYKRSTGEQQQETVLQYDKQKRQVANRSFLIAVILYLVSWFILTGASSAKLARGSEKEPVLLYSLGLLGVLAAIYLCFRGAKLFYLPVSEPET
ncbi:MAG: hypothetical protein Roseis2KO_60320 [Roseivirga sp.]